MNQSELNHVRKELKKQLQYSEYLLRANFNINTNLSPTDLKEKAASQEIGNINLYLKLTSGYRATLSLLLELD